MTTDHVATATPRRFNPLDAEHAKSLTDLYRAYLLEEFERTGGDADGLPIAPYLFTYFVDWDGTPVGFVSASPAHRAVELVYIAPEFRGHGLARVVLEDLRSTCPGPMRIKGPLTPAGKALSESLAIPEEVRDAQTSAEVERDHREMTALLSKACRHQRGNPGRACKRCYRKYLSLSAEVVVRVYVNAVKAGVITAA